MGSDLFLHPSHTTGPCARTCDFSLLQQGVDELGKLRTLWEATSATLTHRGRQHEPLNPCKKPVGVMSGTLGCFWKSIISLKVSNHIEEGDEKWGRGPVTWSLRDTRNKPDSSSCHTHPLSRHLQSWE